MMAVNPSRVRLTEIPRFRRPANDGWLVTDIKLGANNVVALSGGQYSGPKTFVDIVETFSDRPCKITYGREFDVDHEGQLHRRVLAFLGCSSFVTSAHGVIESYGIRRDVQPINGNTFAGSAASMAISVEGEVYVGLHKSCEVIIFNNRLIKTTTITLSGMEGNRDWVDDIAVMGDTLFFRSWYGRALVHSTSGSRHTQLNTRRNRVWSITADSEQVFVLWDGGRRVTVYDLVSLIVPGHRGRHVALFDFRLHEAGCFYIRVMNNRLATVNRETGEVREYKVKDLCTFDNLLSSSLDSAVSDADVKNLAHRFSIPTEQADTIGSLVRRLAEAGTSTPENNLPLIRACRYLGLENAAIILSAYQKLALLASLATLVDGDDLVKLADHFSDLLYRGETITDINALLRHFTKTGTLTPDVTLKLISACRDLGLEGALAHLDRLYETFSREELSNRMCTLVEEYRNQKRAIEDNQRKCQNLADRVSVLEGEKKDLTSQLKASTANSDYLTGILAAADSEKLKLYDKLVVSEDEKQNLTARVGVLEDEKQDLKEGLEAATAHSEQLTDRLAAVENERLNLKDKVGTLERRNQDLTHGLREAKEENQCLAGRLTASEEQLNQSRKALSSTRTDLHQSQRESAKESKALKEVLEQTRQASRKEGGGIAGEGPEEAALITDSEDVLFNESFLAADFGRLMVDVAEDLTLDSSLKLAVIFGLPPAKIDLLRRISMIETPGNKLLDILKERDVINMYDVTNLQRGLLHIHLAETNELLVSYQEKVDPVLWEENKSTADLPWPEDGSSMNESQPTNLERTDETTARASSSREEDIDVEIPLAARRHRNPYIEQIIGKEGGTISIDGVRLSVPADALTKDRVIAVEVIYDHMLHLPGDDDRSRITPLVKLGPLGLAPKKPVTLTIPHSAVIPEPDRHTITVYTGQEEEEEEKDVITWAKERSIPPTLGEDTVSVSIRRLGYLTVSLVSAAAEQRHTMRIVPFVDGVDDPEDDVIITVCLCRDSDDEYKSLTEAHQPKLRLGGYSTCQFIRSTSDSTPSLLEMAIASNNGSAYSPLQDTTRLFRIDHVCRARDVFHQFRLQKSTSASVDTSALDVKLTLRYGSQKLAEEILQTKVQNLLMSAESRKLLQRQLEPDVLQYEALKLSIAAQLDRLHCEKLSLFFSLTPVENERILDNKKPGRMLMKILDEREMIMPNKMIDLYEGLKASHLDKVARTILDYTAALHDIEKQSDVDRVSGKSVRSKSTKIGILMERGFLRPNILRALGLAKGRMELSLKILQFVQQQKETVVSLKEDVLYKEQFVGEAGGVLQEGGISVSIPPGALEEGRIVNLSVTPAVGVEQLPVGGGARIAQIVRCGPEGLLLGKPALLRIPHCGVVLGEGSDVAVYAGEERENSREWQRMNPSDARCSMSSRCFEIWIRKFGLFYIAVKSRSGMNKLVRALPLIGRITAPTDDLIVSLWLYNDDEVEERSLIHDEIQRNGNIQLGGYSSFLLAPEQKSFLANMDVMDRAAFTLLGSSKIEVNGDELWMQTRCKVEFRLRYKGGSGGHLGLKMTSRGFLRRRPLCEFRLSVEVQELFSSSRDMASSLEHEIPRDMLNSFGDLRTRISEMLDSAAAVQIATIVGLPADVKSAIRCSGTPGSLLVDRLTEGSVISAAKVSPLERALMSIGNTDGARLVQEYRKNNMQDSSM